MIVTAEDIAAALAAEPTFPSREAALLARGFDLTGWSPEALDIAIRQWTMERGGLDVRVNGYDGPNYQAALLRWSGWPSPTPVP